MAVSAIMDECLNFEYLDSHLNTDYKNISLDGYIDIYKNGKIKISKGIYSDKPIANELVSICKSYPKAIVTLDSAFYYYNLTDVIPQAVYLASVRDSYKIKSDRIKQTFQPIKIFGRGKVIIKTKEGIINIYSRYMRGLS